MIPGNLGTNAQSNPTSFIRAPAWRAPPPPNGIAAKVPGSWPLSTETNLIALAIFPFATRRIASAASKTFIPKGSATSVLIAHLAASTSNLLSLSPIGFSEFILPNKTFASVTVGAVLPNP